MLSKAHQDNVKPGAEGWRELMLSLVDRPGGCLIERDVMAPGQLYFTVTVDLKSDAVTVYSYQKLSE